MSESHKSAGQLAYEADVRRRPTYHNGTARPTWEMLSEWKRQTWERPAPSISGEP